MRLYIIDKVMSQPSLAQSPTIVIIPAKAAPASFPLQKQQQSIMIAMTAEIEKNTTVYHKSAAEAVCAVDAVIVEANYSE